MSAFRRRLGPPRPGKRRWLFVPYDQLSDQLGPLSREPAAELGIVLVECPAKAARRPYHQQKLALVLANLRWFALEQAGRGVAVRHVVSPGDYAAALAPLAAELGPLRTMVPAERELRVELAPLVERGLIELIPHEGWITEAADLGKGPPWRMDAFYRRVRKKTGLLLEAGGKPLGGKWSFDPENRKAWSGTPPAPAPPRYPRDEIKEEVGALVRARFADHPGTLDLDALPATAADAEATWRWARRACLPHFGPFEDAMSTRSSGLFHTRISALLNLSRLLPGRVVREVAGDERLPLASREGFVRQILGWREYVRHVHVATDGFRAGVPRAALGEGRPLPPAYWGKPSGLACLDRVVADVWREGYSHHITRLMVLSNLALLLDLSPRELTDWFWIAYTDAYDWVVEPNVLGMGTFSAGDAMTTKPYVAGAAYIDKMSDYCGGCAFDPKRNCPITRLYWAFLARHEAALAGNQRLAMPLASVRRRSPAERARDAETFDRIAATLARGEPVAP